MITHVLGITVATACVVLCTFLPFLPGRYDSLAVPLSLMAQVIGKVGLVLVPVGILWMVSEYRRPLGRHRYAFAIAAFIAGAIVWLLVSLGGLVESVALGLCAIGLGAYAGTRMLPRLRALRSAPNGPIAVVPAYLIVVPIAVALLQLSLDGPATEFGRNRAIRNSASLIADIEAHRAANGRYPPSVMSVWPDYKPSIIGIREYRYEPSGDAYNVMFELPTLQLGTREIVMYNPTDRQAIASHALDVIQLSPRELEVDRGRGYYAVHDARHPHWKYFWFD